VDWRSFVGPAAVCLALTLAGCASLKNFPGDERKPRTTANEPPPALRPPADEPPRPAPPPPVTAQAAPAVPLQAPTPPRPDAVPVSRPSAVAQAAAAMPTLPLTQIDDRLPAADLDNRTFALTFAQPVAIRDLLLLLVRGTSLSMIPDPGISGAFIGELKNVTVRQALDLILQPLGLDYRVDGGFIRVFKREPEMRLFDVNYIATERTGTVATGTGVQGGSTAQVSSRTATDVFSDLAKGVQPLLSERASFSLDRKAGLLQVIDFPERLDRVAVYLDAVHDRVHRQVQIDVRVVEVQLTNAAAQTIDWNAVAPAGPPAAGGSPTLTSVHVSDVARLLTALEGQGKVTTIAGTRLRTLNNETAILRAASDIQVRTKQDRVTDPVLTDGLTVTVTPQIGSDGSVMLSLSPMLTLGSSDGGKLAGRSSGEADMLARLADGETMVVGGFSHSSSFGRSPGGTSRRTEVLVLLTPKILHATVD
jgi:type II secretory pathway component GspD/PulD (secretin)